MPMARHYRGDEDTEDTQQIYSMPATPKPARHLAHEPYVPMHRPHSAAQAGDKDERIGRLQKLVADLEKNHRTLQGNYADLAERLIPLEQRSSQVSKVLTATYVGFGFLITLLVIALAVVMTR